MTVRATIPPRELVGPDDPLRLDVAARLAYPDGTMTESGLRREKSKGRLVVERTAGKDYTTLRNIERMRELCRLAEKAPGSTCDQPAETSAEPSAIEPSGSSETPDGLTKAQDAAKATVAALKKSSRRTLPASTSKKPRKGNVVPFKFRSRTS